MNDPQANVTNLLFAVDGPNANFLHPPDPAWSSPWPQATDDLMTFYERATRTLILRPVIPLRQQTRYAVLLTKRLKGTDGRAVRSPFPSVNHTLQNGELKPLFDKLPNGLKAEDIAFAWAFTTQSTTSELEAIREGLYGRGPLQMLAARAPVAVQPMAQVDSGANVYILPQAKLVELVSDPAISSFLVGSDQAQVKALLDSMKYIDYYIAGSFQTTNFLDDPSRAPQDATFDVDLHEGRARTSPQTVYFFASVPRPLAGRKPPFPVALYGHGYTSMRLEGVLLAGGQAAKFGFAVMDIEAFGHGLDVDPVLEALIREVLRSHGMAAFAEGIFKGRARDLDNDGVVDSGGDFWTADTFHTRDVVRQSIVDWMQLVRLLRTFDGVTSIPLGTDPDTLNPGKFVTHHVAAGDFNGDG